MNAGQKSAARVAASTGRQLKTANIGMVLTARKAQASRASICKSCLDRLSYQTRRNAATSAAVAEETPPHIQQPDVPPVTSTGPRKAYRLLSSPVLSRPPVLTRTLTEFEKAYYLYQKRLNERLALPFTRYFYYKKGTPADLEWKRKAKTRRTAARDIGVYNAYGDEAWNDELLVGDRQSEPETQIESLIRDAEGRDILSDRKVGDSETEGESIAGDMRKSEGEAVRKDVGQTFERPAPRETEADRSGDVTSLSRKMDRSLYLLVKNKEGRWRFPEDRVYGRENLHQVRESLRCLVVNARVKLLLSTDAW